MRLKPHGSITPSTHPVSTDLHWTWRSVMRGPERAWRRLGSFAILIHFPCPELIVMTRFLVSGDSHPMVDTPKHSRNQASFAPCQVSFTFVRNRREGYGYGRRPHSDYVGTWCNGGKASGPRREGWWGPRGASTPLPPQWGPRVARGFGSTPECR